MVFLNRIYTKSGDTGDTGLSDGTRVAKDAARVTAYGEVDELNSVLGVALLCPEMPERDLLRLIQNELFDLGADLSTPIAPDETPGRALRMTVSQAERLEKAIDAATARLEPLRSFVLPGGSPGAAHMHLARTVCRRAERAVVTLQRAEAINPQALIYLNRLSDLLFVLARLANDEGRSDVLWVPGQSRG